MARLLPGEHRVLTAPTVRIRVRGIVPDAVSLALFPVGEDRVVRDAADVADRDHPRAGAIRLVDPRVVTIGLEDLDPAIEFVRVALHLARATIGSLAAVDGLALVVEDGASSLDVPVECRSSERSMVVVELARTSRHWRIRSLCAGWPDGFDALALEHGLDRAAPSAHGPHGDTAAGVLDLAGDRIVRICLDSAIELLTTSGYHLELAGPITLRRGGRTVVVRPGRYDATFPASELVRLHDAPIGTVVYDAEGTLRVECGADTVLTVDNCPTSVAWQMHGPGGDLTIALPGDGVQTWTTGRRHSPWRDEL